MRIRRVPTDRFPPVKPVAPRRGRPRRPPVSRTAGRRRSSVTAGALGGKRLATAAHPVAVKLDPQRRGIGPRELQQALTIAGVAIGGADPYITVYAMLNDAPKIFERAGRGRYCWLDPRNADVDRVD